MLFNQQTTNGIDCCCVLRVRSQLIRKAQSNCCGFCLPASYPEAPDDYKTSTSLYDLYH